MGGEGGEVGAGRDAGLGVFAGGVDLNVNVEGGGGGEGGSTGVELGCFFGSVDGGDKEEVRDLGGEGFAFVWGC